LGEAAKAAVSPNAEPASGALQTQRSRPGNARLAAAPTAAALFLAAAAGLSAFILYRS
jgi:hypothetical protein